MTYARFYMGVIPKMRRKKAKLGKVYFTQETEDAIIKYGIIPFRHRISFLGRLIKENKLKYGSYEEIFC